MTRRNRVDVAPFIQIINHGGGNLYERVRTVGMKADDYCVSENVVSAIEGLQ
jgi:hypothetical protein